MWIQFQVDCNLVWDTNRYLPPILASVALIRQPDSGSVTSAKLGCGSDGCLPESGYLPCCTVVCLWCIMWLCAECFSCSHTVLLPKEHSLGVIFFSSPFLMLYFSSKSYIHCWIIPCMIVYVTNKLTLTLICPKLILFNILLQHFTKIKIEYIWSKSHVIRDEVLFRLLDGYRYVSIHIFMCILWYRIKIK